MIAIGLAIRTRQVHLSLLAGIGVGMTLMAGGNPLSGAVGAVEAVVQVAATPSNARLLFFCLLIGPLVAYLESFRGEEHLRELERDARVLLARVLAGVAA